MTATRLALLALALLPVAARADHTREHAREQRVEEQRTDKQRTAVERTVTGRSIADRIMDAFRKDPVMAGENLGVVVAAGEVTLSGAVPSLYAKARAERIAENVRGVVRVKNKIAVRPKGPLTDRLITRQINDGLASDPATSHLDLNVATKNGVATLSGSAPTLAEAELALRLAEEVFGVREVKGDIIVEQDLLDERPAGEVESEVRVGLGWDTTVDADAIDVRYRDGTVTLLGAVASAAAKRNAIESAWVEGVTHVDASRLKVDPTKGRATRPPRLPDGATAAVEPGKGQLDDAIKGVLERRLLQSPRLSDADLSVDVDVGVVTLRGDVDSLAAKREATRAARNTYGVLDVKNRLRVDPALARSAAEAPLDDEGAREEAIKRALEGALLRDPLVSPSEVAVEVVGGEVYLEGRVDNVLEKMRADDLAARTAGVTAVHNELAIDERGALARVGLDDEDAPYVYEWYSHAPAASAKSDREIREALLSELFWRPVVDERGITVRVDDGFVKLEGSVDSSAERQAATERAYEAGAVWVDNELAVRSGT